MEADLTVALDVDGVLSPVCDPAPGVLTPEPPCSIPGPYHAIPGPAGAFLVHDNVRATLQRLAAHPGVHLTWHTSWREEADAVFREPLGLPSLPQFATTEEWLSTGPWWKLQAVTRWLDETEGTPRRLVWIDDDILDAINTGEVSAKLLHHPRLTILSPALRVGLTRTHLHYLSRLADTPDLRPAYGTALVADIRDLDPRHRTIAETGWGGAITVIPAEDASG